MAADRALMMFTAQTLVHAGASTSFGAIDLPIQREAHTAWPVVFASGVKGALRELAENSSTAADAETVRAVFGPGNDEVGNDGALFEGALAVGDLQILALPVRSMTTHCRLVTCPAVLHRYANHCARLGLRRVPAVPAGPPDTEGALSASESGSQFIEERLLEVQQDDAVGAWAARLRRRSDLAGQLPEGLLVLHDDTFRWLAEAATHKAMRTALDENKTVKAGALWIEEALVPDTLMYAPLLGMRSRHPDPELNMDGEQVLAFVEGLFAQVPYLRVGGNETLGQGWGRIRFHAPGGAQR